MMTHEFLQIADQHPPNGGVRYLVLPDPLHGGTLERKRAGPPWHLAPESRSFGKKHMQFESFSSDRRCGPGTWSCVYVCIIVHIWYTLHSICKLHLVNTMLHPIHEVFLLRIEDNPSSSSEYLSILNEKIDVSSLHG